MSRVKAKPKPMETAPVETIDAHAPARPAIRSFVAWALGATSLALLTLAWLLLVQVDDVDDGYYPSQRYGNIGNIHLPTSAPYMGYGPIDVVYTWVNGTDPRWKQEKTYWHRRWNAEIHGDLFNETDNTAVADASAAASENRFRDNEELRYSLRSIEKYAPWVRHVYLVTDGQVPSWLNLDCPRLTVVPHRAMFANTSHLPVFSSPAIEANLDTIPGLSDHFLYFNDDVFLGAPVTPEDFMSPSGVQNIYLSWEVPECAQHCGEPLLGNGVCDSACNVTACGFDMGDCGCTETFRPDDPLQLPHVECTPSATSEPDAETPPPTLATSTLASHLCTDGCTFSWIGDGVCDLRCNVTECAYDGGDCGVGLFSRLPSSAVPANTTSLTIVMADTSPVLVVNMSEIFEFVDAASLDNDELVRHATLVEANMSLVLVLARHDSSGSVTNATEIVIRGAPLGDEESSANLTLHLVRGQHGLLQGRYTPQPANEIDLSDLRLQQQPSMDDGTIDLDVRLPFFAVPDWSEQVLVTSNWVAHDAAQHTKSFHATCPVIAPAPEATATADTADCVMEAQTLRVRFSWSVPDSSAGVVHGKICVWNRPSSNCVDVALAYGAAIVLSPATAAEPWNGLFDAGEDCVLADYVARAVWRRLSGTCAPQRVESHAADGNKAATSDALPAVDPFVRDQALLMCRQLANRRYTADAIAATSWWTPVTDAARFLRTKLGLATVAPANTTAWALSTPNVEACADFFSHVEPDAIDASPLPPRDDDAVRSMDTFGDSLRHVNKLYNSVFGKTPTADRRRVPSHMPHFIQKKLLTEMKAQWPLQFNATSSHRFRHPKDMQFSFSYMYYVVNRHLLHPPTLDEIFATYIDLNKDGIIDEHEVLSVASLLTTEEHPSEADVNDVKRCLTPPPIATTLVHDEARRSGRVTVTETIQPYKTLESLKACTNVSARLIATVQARRPILHRFVSESEVTFHMLSDQYRTAWNQLLNTRARKTKFVCINDDMKYPSQAVSGILHDLFTSLWPDRSQFELPFHLTNKYGHVDEIAAGRVWQWQLAAMTAVLLAGLYVIFACNHDNHDDDRDDNRNDNRDDDRDDDRDDRNDRRVDD